MKSFYEFVLTAVAGSAGCAGWVEVIAEYFQTCLQPLVFKRFNILSFSNGCDAK
jgi:hypothetical protein